jgi:1,2-diacylglycerol 3-beta-glucosyltransferase
MGLILAVLGCVVLLITTYLLLLAAAALVPERRPPRGRAHGHRFAVVVPAHNEAAIIGETLKSLFAMRYPRELFDVIVVADNCTDDTAAIAGAAGARCLVRTDDEHRGKGQALDWAFRRILASGSHEAFVVIDADTLVEAGFLEAMNRRLCEGEQAIQGYYDVQHPWASPVESLSYLGFVATRLLRYRGRSNLGWSSNLLGNGMCFARGILERFGWSATSILEDVEFGMQLQLAGIRVAFAEEAVVYAEIPGTFKAAANQRGRWDLGKMQVTRRYLPRLLAAALAKGDLRCLDAALELAVPPFPILIAVMVLGFAAFFSLGGPAWGAVAWLAVAAEMAVFTVLCLVIAKARPRVYLSLLWAPFFLAWRIVLMIRDIFEKKHRQWVKTDRGPRAA